MKPQEIEIDVDDCPITPTQDYYSCKMLLSKQKQQQQQQKQTIALLAQVPAFNGKGATKFEEWIQHFEGVIGIYELEEGKKIKLLRSKLFGTALDCISDFQLSYPRESQSYSKIKNNLHERYHGGETRKMYYTEYKNCVRNSGETIRDYGGRLKKLYSYAYPGTHGHSYKGN